MSDKLLPFLGLARRAGKLSLGHDPAMDQIRHGKAKLILLACDLSERTAASIREEADMMKISVRPLRENMDEIGSALGRRTGVIAVNDAGFAKKLETLCATDEEECNL